MGRRSKYTFLQIRHTDSQKAYKKRCSTSLIIVCVQALLDKCKSKLQKKKKSYNEVLSQTSQNDHHQKNLQTISAGEGVEKRETSYTVSVNVNWYSYYEQQYGDALKN